MKMWCKLFGIILLCIAFWLSIYFAGPVVGPLLFGVLLIIILSMLSKPKRYKPKDYWYGP